jgi:hypothetical protein
VSAAANAVLGALVLALACVPAHAQTNPATKRSYAAKVAFARANPCPASGKPVTRCAGYVIDHIDPLCAGGADSPANMRWQTIADSKVKDRLERRLCAALRKCSTGSSP